ncbi:MAG: CDP-diacylglycerol--glycerol-3-phosphate 3-phosphatidyltransferase [Acidimicrobiales bacterium]
MSSGEPPGGPAEAPRRDVELTYGPSALATPANFVTVVRLLSAPVLFAMIADTVATWPNFFFWTILAGTDLLDGRMARRYGSTRSGAFLDPLADKVLVLGAMFALVAADVFPLLPVAVIAARELVISLLRVQLGRQGLAVPARPSAKAKTLTQALAVGAAVMPWLRPHPWVASSLLWLAVALALVSGAQYLLDGRRAATTMSRAPGEPGTTGR